MTAQPRRSPAATRPAPSARRRTPARAALALRPHQRAAVEDILTHFQAGGERASVVMPCGTGKTRVGAAVAQQLTAHATPARVAVFLPSLALVEQTLREWDALPGLDIDPVLLCSDATTADAAHDRRQAPYAKVHWLDRAVPVTTDPDRLARLLSRGPRHGTQVVFATYHSAPVLAQAVRYAAVPVHFDVLIADEAHHLAGDPSAAFRLTLDDGAIPARHRLHMTATPRLEDTARSGALHMADAATFGPLVHTLTFARAIADGLLCDYRVLVMAEESAAAGGGDLAAIALQALRSAASRHGFRSAVTFHSRVRDARRFTGLLRQAGPLEDGRSVWAHTVTATSPVRERAAATTRLGEPEPGALHVVSNARCLAEGVDVPALDAVVFAAPKHSPVDIIQAVGRALRPAPGKDVGTIVIPVALPPGSLGGDDDTALLTSAFAHVWAVLRALRAHDERFEAQMRTLLQVQSSRRGTLTGERDHARISWVLPPQLLAYARTRLVEEVAQPWELMFAALQAHTDRAGACPAPYATTTDPDGRPIGQWADRQRTAHRRGLLPTDRAARLAALPGWVWSATQGHWRANVAALAAAPRTGTGGLDYAALSAASASGPVRSLGAFAATARVEHRAGALSSAQAAELEAVAGWDWDPLPEPDRTGVDLLAEFVAWERHANVPADHREGGFDLGAWLAGLRRRKLLGTAAPELLDELAAVTPSPDTAGALSWDARGTQWLLGLDAVRAFAAREGHLRPGETHREVIDGRPVHLHRWMVARRHEGRRGQLSPERVALLEAVPGWRWVATAAPRVAADIGDTPHGTRTGYVKKCRCQPCTDANRVEYAARQERRATGTSRWADPTPVREHLQSLLARGASQKALARATGLNRKSVQAILTGTAARVSPQVAGTVLAVTAEQVAAATAPGTIVDAAPTWVLLDDLLERGWPKTWIARELGGTGVRPALQIRRTTVLAATAQRVRELHDRVGPGRPPRLPRGAALPPLARLAQADTA